MNKNNSAALFEHCILIRCKQGPLITDDILGEVTCGSCGVIVSEKLEDNRPEYRIFTKEDYMQRTRTGMRSTLTIHDMGLATVIESKNKDASGKQLSKEMSFEFKRLRAWDTRSKLYSRERTMLKAFTLLDGMASKLGLPQSVSEKAAYFYRKIKSKNPRISKSTESLICAALYAACRFTNTPRTLNDIAQISNVKKKLLQKNYRDIINNLSLNLEQYDPIEFISRLSSDVGASEKTRRYTSHIIAKARKAGVIAGRNPIGIAAAALYMSCINNDERISQAQIAKAAGISSVTIRSRYQTLIKEITLQ